MIDIIVVLVAIIVFTVLIVGVYEKNTNAICGSKKRLDGKTVLVTGGTAGMGLEIATNLACRGARTIIACPFRDEGLSAEKHIIRQSNNNNVIFKYLDLSSLESVRTFASDILKTEDRLDILINNAGVGVPGDFYTKDGINFIMQVNFFGTFLLTLLLLPLLKKTGLPSDHSRIVNTSSVLHLLGTVDIEHINEIKYYFKFRVYANSKLCITLFTHELSKRLQGSNVVVNSVDPGAVGTRIFEAGNKAFGKFLKYYFLYVFKTPWQGAQTALHVALDTEAGRVSGQFFKNCQISKAAACAYNDSLSRKLWDESLIIVKLNGSELETC